MVSITFVRTFIEPHLQYNGDFLDWLYTLNDNGEIKIAKDVVVTGINLISATDVLRLLNRYGKPTTINQAILDILIKEYYNVTNR